MMQRAVACRRTGQKSRPAAVVPGHGPYLQPRAIRGPVRGPNSAQGAGHPLALGRTMRARLARVVRKVLADVGAVDSGCGVRLAAVVLLARTPRATGVVEIRTSELARWLGLSPSYVASTVLPALRRSRVVDVATRVGEFGEDSGLACRVSGALVLSRGDLATLLRLLEALMAPGWVHRDGTITPAGLLGGRTGRGAAVDRLALLLMVLEARSSGRVRLCGGVVDAKRGRPVATVARLLGCSLHTAERTLHRLEQAGLVARPRIRTASGMVHRSSLVVPTVTAAHSPGRPGRVPGDPADMARPGNAAARDEKAEVRGIGRGKDRGESEPALTAGLHTVHAGVADDIVTGAVVGGVSGEAPSGSSPLPQRAGAREDNTTKRGPRQVPGGGSRSPLRGEQPHQSRRSTDTCTDAGVAPTAGTTVGQQSRRRVSPPQDVRVALEPVWWLWDQVDRGGARARISAAARHELDQVAGIVGPEHAPQVLAERLAYRLAEQGGEALVCDPVAWILGRGLPQRPGCGDPRCDDGVLMDTSTECATCGDVIARRRARRRRVHAETAAHMPDATPEAVRAASEKFVRALVEQETVQQAVDRERAAQVRAAREATRARERAAAEAAERVRRDCPCSDCGAARAAGLCSICRIRRQTADARTHAVLLATAARASLDDAAHVEAVAAAARTELDQAIAQARAIAVADPGDDPVAVACALERLDLLTVEMVTEKYRKDALTALAHGEEATAEAQRAYGTALRLRQDPVAQARARQVAEQARERCAHQLLAERLTALADQSAVPGRTTADRRKHRAERLALLATRPLSEEEQVLASSRAPTRQPNKPRKTCTLGMSHM